MSTPKDEEKKDEVEIGKEEWTKEEEEELTQLYAKNPKLADKFMGSAGDVVFGSSKPKDS